jgi:TonB family protein
MKNIFFVLLLFGFTHTISAQKKISKKERLEVYKNKRDSIWNEYLKEVEIENLKKEIRKAKLDSISQLKKESLVSKINKDTLCVLSNPYHKKINKEGVEEKINLNEYCSLHIKKNLMYPNFAIEYDIQGRVYVHFTIDKFGKINDIYAYGPKNGLILEKEAVRIMQKLPPLEPALCNDKPVSVSYNIPINFKFND